MRLLLSGLYILIIILLQTVVFSRINLWGVVPDLVLVSVILFAVQNGEKKSALFAAAGGFLQDVLSFGIYINTILKVVVAALVGAVKESFMGNEYYFVAVLVAVFTPLSMLAEAGVLLVFLDKQIELYPLFLNMAIATLYNLVLVPILFPLVKRLSYD
jgi:rod shape-determining protein MreD